jgi:aminopeptidase N
VVVSGAYDSEARTYRLDLAQGTAPTPGQPLKEPVVIPVALGLVAADGTSLAAANPRVREDGVFVLDRASDSILFSDVGSRPVPSVFRGLSAPVRVALDLSDDDLLTLLRHDTDPFNRWQAGQSLATRLLVRLSQTPQSDGAEAEGLAQALLAFLEENAEDDPAFAAQVLTLPSEAEIAGEIAADVDPDAIHRARKAVRAHVGRVLRGELARLRDALTSSTPYSPDAGSAGRRSLRNVALELIAVGDPMVGTREVAAQYAGADNMTDRLAALAVNAQLPPSSEREELFARFYAEYRNEPLVVDKWFALQATMPEDGTLERVLRLMNDPAFSITNPNRVRALVGSFALNNATQFHRADGAGYAFLADMVVALDGTNPQVAARLLTAFGTWRTMSAERRAGAEAALRRVAAKPSLSPDVSDIVHRSLG